MKLQTKIWAVTGAIMCVTLAAHLTLNYREYETFVQGEVLQDARNLRGVLMATRRVYHKQFLESGLPITDATVGFLPAHSLSRISKDFPNWSQSGYLFNNVSDRPRNPANLADANELNAMAWFRLNPTAKERLAQITDHRGKPYFHFTAPIWIEPYCLGCHGDPKDAPVSIQSHYKESYGYGLGQLGGVMSIKIPLEEVRQRTFHLWQRSLGQIVAGYAALFVVLGYLLSRLIVRRIARLERSANRIAQGDYSARTAMRSNDELAHLGHTLDHMAEAIQARDRTLQESEARFRIMAEQSSDWVWLMDTQGRHTYSNNKIIDSLGLDLQDFLGADLSSLIHPEDRSLYRATFEKALAEKTGWHNVVLRWRHRDGGYRHLESSATAVFDDSGVLRGFQGADRDITERKEAEEQIVQLAFYDALTGLPNRRLLLDRLNQALIVGSRSQLYGAILFIDLDDFKTLNDSLGHDTGDILLVDVARRLTACVREDDTVARLGGDEFIVLLENISAEEQEAAARTEMVGDKILSRLNQPYRLNNRDWHSTPSIGITLFHGREMSVEELLKRADLAMYQAKEAGRNTLRFFDPVMQARLSERAQLESELKAAIQNGTLALHYQAQVDRHGRLVGAEALARWPHPQRGWVSPVDFIPLAEESGLIMALGHSVLIQACTLLAIWQASPATAELTLAVNVSARQFQHADFVDDVLAILRNTGARPRRLKLELTESLLLDNVEATIEKMTILRGHGIEFALDDFGTGFSSLTYLKRLPLNQLKIDQSFVRDVLTDPSDATLARTIITLGATFGLGVIAEGVETREQGDFLIEAGCPMLQGYLYGKPMAIEEFKATYLTSDKPSPDPP
jgi:diguanylate cyclase (GGDEF)-like protein/PAS domain S-box-containing protein